MVYTLPRLKAVLQEKLDSLATPLWVGGWVRQSSPSRHCLEGQGLSLWVAEEGSWPIGAWVEVRVEPSVKELENFLNLSQKEQACRPWPVSEVRVGSSLPSTGVHFLKTRQWHQFLKEVSQFCDIQQWQSISTPFLIPSPGLESQLDPFVTTLKKDDHDTEVYLPTSPEIALKKSLCQGWTDIFEIKTCFRNNEYGSLHRNEFHILEWYRAHVDLSITQEDVQKLVTYVVGRLDKTSQLSFQDFTMSELFQKYLGVDLTPQTTKDDLLRWSEEHKIPYVDEPTWTDLFHSIFLEKIEPHLQEPTFITKYPPSEKAAAQLDAEGWAQRFEFYWRGLEIANAFYEVTDPQEQKKRFEEDQRDRETKGHRTWPWDRELEKLMTNPGMPPASGVALGLERLFMALRDLKSIDEVQINGLITD